MKNKSANFDLNLLPIISLLAVLISFLLLTTTWVHISSLNVKQSIGDQSTKENAQVDQENYGWSCLTVIICNFGLRKMKRC